MKPDGWGRLSLMGTPALTVVGTLANEGHFQDGHPERPARMSAVAAGLDDLHLGSDVSWLEPRSASDDELGLVHSPEYLAVLRRLSERGGGSLDVDTYLTPASWGSAQLAAGGGLVAIESLQDGGSGYAFVAARPPGHHALAGQGMGFCLINNVAVSAAFLRQRGERVLIVDWDVHHGNGTEALFWEDPNVMYVSTHQWPCYPGTGRADDVGFGPGKGTTINIPLPPGATGDVILGAFELLVSPAVEVFQPTWVLISAGFDAHRDDPLADLSLSSGDFAALATTVAAWAPRAGRVVLFLEGGYDLGALRSSTSATLGALVGATRLDEPQTTGGPGMDRIPELQSVRREVLARDS
jgi:acetoin utilization deacetylase AcuC-like enzyme